MGIILIRLTVNTNIMEIGMGNNVVKHNHIQHRAVSAIVLFEGPLPEPSPSPSHWHPGLPAK